MAQLEVITEKMGNLRHLLEKKERLERFLIAQSIALIELAPDWGKQLSAVLYMLLLSMGAIAVLVLVSGTSRYRVVYKLVEPGHYRPQQCSEWRFESGTENLLREGLEQLDAAAQALNATVLPGNQLGLPFCAIQVQRQQMLNPRISMFEGQSAHYTVNPRGLCSSKSEFKVELSPAITLNWIDPQTQEMQFRRFTNPIAGELQVALLIQKGEKVCT